MQNEKIIETICYHCGDSFQHKRYVQGDKNFCCSGCQMVFNLLEKNELCTYYDLNSTPGTSQRIEKRKDKFSFLDNKDIAYRLLSYRDGKKANVLFYLPQIHCSSCLWLLENLSLLNDGIISSRVNFSNKEVLIIFDETQTSLRFVVETLAATGYEPHLSFNDIDSHNAIKIDRSRWFKLGIAGFCFANIMMLSLPDYFSGGKKIGNGLDNVFHFIIIILSIPVFFYCASEFFRNAWFGIKNKYLNIDAPIALALIITFLRSIYEMLFGIGNGYFDSMSGIVFFMLIGRWLQDRTNTAISFDRDYKSFFPISVNKKVAGNFTSSSLDTIKVNDIILVHKNELVPADCLLSKGKAIIDYSFVNGESIPVVIRPGEMIYAGGRQTDAQIELLVLKEVSQSYLTSLWGRNNFSKEIKPSNSLYDSIGKYFTYGVLLIGLLAGVYWSSKGLYNSMWNALTTVLIVACPCALLLSASYTKGNILRVLGLNKFFLRGHDVIDRLYDISTIVFDKTGTLTCSNKSTINFKGKIIDDELKACLAALLKQSVHPLSKTVYTHLNVSETSEPDSFKETEGEGIECWINDHHIKAGSAHFTGADINQSANSSVLHILVDNIYYGSFSILNIYREGIPELLKRLKTRYSLTILSGDNDAEYKNLSAMLSSGDNILFNQKPCEKFQYIAKLQKNNEKIMLVGDGLNDAIAIKQSDIGVAVSDSNLSFTPASDAIIDASALCLLDKFIAFAGSSRKIIIFSFVFSIAYNLIGLWFAVQGQLSPLIAAILMPLSSISIIFLTYYFTQFSAWSKGLKIKSS